MKTITRRDYGQIPVLDPERVMSGEFESVRISRRLIGGLGISGYPLVHRLQTAVEGDKFTRGIEGQELTSITSSEDVKHRIIGTLLFTSTVQHAINSEGAVTGVTAVRAAFLRDDDSQIFTAPYRATNIDGHESFTGVGSGISRNTLGQDYNYAHEASEMFRIASLM